MAVTFPLRTIHDDGARPMPFVTAVRQRVRGESEARAATLRASPVPFERELA